MTSLTDQNELVHQMMHIAQWQVGPSVFTGVPAHIASYDPRTHSVRCIIPHWTPPLGGDPAITGWVPLGTLAANNGWGIQAAPLGGATFDDPTLGEQVVLLCLHAAQGYYIAVGITWPNVVQVAKPDIQGGEIYVKSASGASVYLKTDGSVVVDGVKNVDINGATNVNVTAGSQVNVTAPEINLGSSGEALQELVTAAMVNLFNGHTHPDLQGGSTGTPQQQMGSAELTSVVKGG